MNRRRLLSLLPGLALPAWWTGDSGPGAVFRPWAPGVSAAGGASRHAAPGPPSGHPGQADVESPRVIVLGTAQDAGVPQVNCFRDHCARVRAGDAPPPRVASLGLFDPAPRTRFLVDATPDLPEQLAALLAVGADEDLPPAVEGRTVPLHEVLHGIFLTHAHIGHYLGLAQLGKEVAAPRELPVWATDAMAAFLESNGPWDILSDSDYIDLRRITPGQPVNLTDRLRITPFAVIHRPEYSDTVGYRIAGPSRSLAYVPDADTWEGWPVPFEEVLGGVDIALLDGSFYSRDELGHRFQGEVPHPPVIETLERLAAMPRRPEVWFIHLNHTNPLWDPDSPLRRQLPDGVGIATTGQRFTL